MQARHNLEELERIATRLRLHVVNMIAPSGQGYVQQGLGAADIFTSLYFAEATLDPANPAWPDRDRIFLTTAHNTAISTRRWRSAGSSTRNGSPPMSATARRWK